MEISILKAQGVSRFALPNVVLGAQLVYTCMRQNELMITAPEPFDNISDANRCVPNVVMLLYKDYPDLYYADVYICFSVNGHKIVNFYPKI